MKRQICLGLQFPHLHLLLRHAVLYTRSGVGAVASQNVTDPTLGSKTLDYIQNGLSAKEAVEEVKRNSQFPRISANSGN